MDDDHDGNLNVLEFSKYAYDSYKSYAEFETTITKPCLTALEKFAELDIDSDTYEILGLGLYTFDKSFLLITPLIELSRPLSISADSSVYLHSINISL